MSLFEPIFSALNERELRYVVVGGTAVVLHGYVRLTVDLDLVVDPAPAASRHAVEALTGLGLRPRLPVDPSAFADPDQRRIWVEERNLRVFSMWDPDDPLREVDLFVEEPIPFEDLWQRSVEVKVGSVSVRVASKTDLIRMKRLAGRPRDLEDIEALEQIDDEE